MRNLKLSALDPALPTTNDNALFDTIDNIFLKFENISLPFKILADMDFLSKLTNQSLAPVIPLKILELDFDLKFVLSLVETGISLPTK